MPGSRGRLVGEAYVLMRADGTLMKADMRKFGKQAAAEAAEDGGRTFRRQWREELAGFEAEMLPRMRRAFAKMTVEQDFRPWIKQFSNVNEAQVKLTEQLNAWRDQNLMTIKDQNRIEAAFRKTTREMEKETIATQKAALATRKLRDSYGQMQQELETGRVRAWGKAMAEADIDGQFERMSVKGEDAADTVKRLRREMELYADDLSMSKKQQDALNVSLTKWQEKVKSVRVEQEKIAKTDIKVTADVDTSKLDKAAFAIRRLAADVDTLGGSVGRAFGKGSRNDLLNFMGVLIGAPFKLIGSGFALVANSAGRFVEEFGKLKAEGGVGVGMIGSLRAVLPVLARSLGGPQGVVALVAGLVAALGAFAYVLPGLVSLISLLAGSLVALAGGVLVGVTAGLLAIAPAAIAAGAGLTLFAVAVAKWSKSKDGKVAIEEFNDELEKSSKILMPEMNRAMSEFTRGFASLVKDVAPGMARVMRNFTDELSSPETQQSLRSWSKSLGVMTEDIGNAISNLSIGMINFFEPILPYAERFSGWLETITENFREWAKSAEGKNSVADWMTKAWEVGKDLWGVVSNLSTALWKVLNLGSEGSGAGLLDSLNAKLRELNEWLDKPENQGKLKTWFADAGDIARQVGEIALEVGKMVKELNSPEGRQGAKDFLEILHAIAQMATGLLKTVDVIKLMFGLMKASAQLMQGNALGAADTASQAWSEYQKTVERSTTAQERHKKSIEDTQNALIAARYQNGPKTDWAQFKILVDDSQWRVLQKAIKDFVFDGKTIPIKGNEDLWNATKGTVASYVFNSKEVQVRANKSEWDNVKGIVERYNFPAKKINLKSPSESELYSLRSYIQNRLQVQIKARVVMPTLPNGSRPTTGGQVVGNALLPGSGAAAAADATSRVATTTAQAIVIQDGAIRINTQAQSPAVIQSFFMDGLAEALERV